jgi:hypothetical protein
LTDIHKGAILLIVNKRTKERKTKEMYFIVVDTETTNSIDDPIAYDIGFAVVDEKGKVYETHSYVVADIFLDKELMSVAYFADKREQYWKVCKKRYSKSASQLSPFSFS